MRRNMKLTIAALAVLVLAVISVSALSFTLADNNPSGNVITSEKAGSGASVGYTQIDNIIDMSINAEDDEQKIYKIVEVGSAAASAASNSLFDLVDSNDFKNYVVDGNRTISDLMADDKVSYRYFCSSDVTNDNTAALTEISNADFIYISNNSNNPFAEGNDLCEELYNVLRIAAVSNYKPVMINSMSSVSAGSGSSSTNLTMQNLASEVYAPTGASYYTYSWNRAGSVTAINFLSHNGSGYIGINGSNRSSSWNDYTDAGTGTVYKTAKVLSITTDGTTVMTSELLADASTMAITATDSDSGVAVTEDYYAISPALNGGTATSMFTYGYNSRYTKPDLLNLDSVSLADLESDITAGTLTFNFEDYDMIVIESNCCAKTISSDLYNKFAAAMYAKISIVYDSAMGTASTTPDDDEVSDELNYDELYYSMITKAGISQFDNVLVTSEKEMSIVSASHSAATCKVIADLINSSSFRGQGGGSGSSSSKFTVLEIQPCYPIDEDVAVEVGKVTSRSNVYTSVFGSGNYYTEPAQVVNGSTKEQLAKNTEYYAWEISPAKIADALGLSVTDINVVHMSTEEFICDKSSVVGNYDMIYIGGNTSAIKDISQYNALNGIKRDTHLSSFQNLTSNSFSYLPIYTMYSHSGDTITLDLSYTGQAGSKINGGTPFGTVYVNGSKMSTFTVLNGNDITYDKMIDLKSYVSAGLPVIFGKDVSTAFGIVNAAELNGNVYLQNSIDPDSNMYKLIKYCYDQDNSTTSSLQDSILWNFDIDALQEVDNDGGRLGSTLTGVVSVYADDQETELLDLYTNSGKRPKLTVTSMPTPYNEYDESTRLTSSTLTYKYRITGSASYSVKLYIDDDGNSTFDETEVMATSSSDTLSIELADDFYGPLYWQLSVTDTTSKQTVSYSNFAYIVSSTAEVQDVNVLQILPASGKGAEGSNTLYFCTVCQQAYDILDYNPYSNSGDFDSYNAHYSGNYIDTSNGKIAQGHYLGLHEHTFGIVSYDSNLDDGKGRIGSDDWSNNLADSLSDRYNFNVDIMYVDEFESISDSVLNEVSKYAPEGVKPYSDAATDEEKETIRSIYNEKASTVHTEYEAQVETTALTEKSLRDGIQALIDIDFVDANGNNVDAKLQQILDERYYYNLFSMASGFFIYNSMEAQYPYEARQILALYNFYVTQKDNEIKLLEEYQDLMRYVNFENWVIGSYDTVIIGPSDDYSGEDIDNDNALKCLSEYIENEGQVIMFHDTLTAFSDAGSSSLTATLREYFGMDRYHSELAEDTTNDGRIDVTTSSGLCYLPYSNKDGYSNEEYFMTNLSYKTDSTKYSTWVNDMNAALKLDDPYIWATVSSDTYLSNISYTDIRAIGASGGGYNHVAGLPYKYAEINWATAAWWAYAASFNPRENTKYGTDRATQNNVGIITTYPFTLGDNLNISGTHSQSYALDIDDTDLTVWYSMAGGNNSKDGSSVYAASPNDGMDSYFMYNNGSVYYCGAGHSKITGVYKDNNDERRLYINIIANSVRKSARKPDIYLYDYTKETNNIVKKDAEGQYYIKTEDMDEYPEFSFKVTTDEEATLTRVRAFYDLDYLTNPSNVYDETSSDVLIFDWDADNALKVDTRTDVGRYGDIFKLTDTDGNAVMDTLSDGTTTQATRLKLTDAYFLPYNYEYTYIVIEVTTTNAEGKSAISYKRLRIDLIDYMFNMT